VPAFVVEAIYDDESQTATRLVYILAHKGALQYERFENG
jgi:hypothetical protein